MPRTLPLVFDDMIHELVELNILISRHQRAAAIVLIDLAITEHIADLQQFADEFDAAFIVGCEVIAVGEVEGINVVFGRG